MHDMFLMFSIIRIWSILLLFTVLFMSVGNHKLSYKNVKCGIFRRLLNVLASIPTMEHLYFTV